MSRNFAINTYFLPVLLPMNSAILHFYFPLIFVYFCFLCEAFYNMEFEL